jgi:hypothetical protein
MEIKADGRVFSKDDPEYEPASVVRRKVNESGRPE